MPIGLGASATVAGEKLHCNAMAEGSMPPLPLPTTQDDDAMKQHDLQRALKSKSVVWYKNKYW